MAVCVIVWSNVHAAAPDREEPVDTGPHRDSVALPGPGVQVLFVPPDRGAPEVRVSGGTRGTLNDGLRIDVLSPAQTGLTVQEQPTLYWYSSGPIRAGMRVSVVVDETNKTVLDAAVSGPLAPGIHAFVLRGTPVRLALNAEYQWSVTAEMSATEPSRNVVASGMIRRVAPAGSAPQSTLRASAEGCAEYARLGLWYDALDAISEAIQRSPQDAARLHMLRSELLQQVGLANAAAADRSGVR